MGNKQDCVKQCTALYIMLICRTFPIIQNPEFGQKVAKSFFDHFHSPLQMLFYPPFD